MSDSDSPTVLSSFLAGLKKRWFIIAVVVAITCANVYPSFGAKSGQCAPINLMNLLLYHTVA